MGSSQYGLVTSKGKDLLKAITTGCREVSNQSADGWNQKKTVWLLPFQSLSKRTEHSFDATSRHCMALPCLSGL